MILRRMLVLAAVVTTYASILVVVSPAEPALAVPQQPQAPIGAIRSGVGSQVMASVVSRPLVAYVNPYSGNPGWPAGLYGVSDPAGLALPSVLDVAFEAGQLEVGASLEAEVLDAASVEAFSPFGAGVAVAFTGVARTAHPESAFDVVFDVDDLALVHGEDVRQRLLVEVRTGCVDDGAEGWDCSGREKVPTRRHFDTGGIYGVVPNGLIGSGGLDSPAGVSILVISTSPRSANGDFSATPFEPLSSYQTGLFSGSAETAYPIPVPPAAAGETPEVTLRYSSGVADGMNGSKNSQASEAGVGWSYQPGFISMTLPTCTNGVHLCWDDDPVYFLNLFGVRSKLIQDDSDGSLFHPQSDPLWVVERLTGAAGSPDASGVYWQVTRQDGTVFRLGADTDPYDGTDSLHSAQWVPVYGAPECPTSTCVKTYQWNIDWAEDTNGNGITYEYSHETNKYGDSGLNYVRAGSVELIQYTRSSGSPQANAQIDFKMHARCSKDDACVWPDDYLDAPTELTCTMEPCAQTVPTFWSTRMLDVIETSVWDGVVFDQVSRFEFNYLFPVPPPDFEGDETTPKLWLDSIVRKGADGGTLGTTSFDFVMLGNRVEFRDSDAGDGVAPQYIPRLSEINTALGGQVRFEYYSGAIDLDGCVGEFESWADQHTWCFQELDPSHPDDGAVVWNKYRLWNRYAETPTVDGTNREVFTYAYNTPSWHVTDLEYRDTQYHSDFRGVKTVHEIDGYSQSNVHTFFQGMDGDSNGSGTKDVSITDSTGASFTDSNWLAGRPLEVRRQESNVDYERTRYFYDSIITAPEDGTAPAPAPDESDVVELVGDWYGNTTDNVGYYRRDTQFFYGPYQQPTLYGNPGDEPIIGDWTGDGRDDIGVYRPSNQYFYFYTGGSRNFGAPNDVPVIGDWDGDGIDDIGVYRPSDATFYLDGQPAKPFGDIGDEPLIGDWNGNGTDQVGVYRPSDQTFYLDGEASVPLGNPGDLPLTGDWNGDNREQAGVYRESDQTFYRDGQTALPWGEPGDRPVIGDWDGTNIDDVGVYRFTTNRFYLRNNDGSTTETQFGAWGEDGARDARWTNVSRIETTSIGTDFGDTKTSNVEYEYTAFGEVTLIRERGEQGNPDDNRTIRHLYYSGTNTGIENAIQRTELWPGNASGVVGEELAYTEYFYDNSTAPLDRGNLTRMLEWTSRTSGGGGQYIETIYGYDTAGRRTRVTDGEGRLTETVYDAFYGHPTTITNAEDHVTSVTFDPRWGVVLDATDPNSNVTTLTYDQHGRLETVTRPGDTTPSTTHTYSALDANPAYTHTITESAGGPVDTIAFVDGFGRTLQTQVNSPATDQIAMRSLTTVAYDDLGRITRQSEPYEVPGTPTPLFGYEPLTDWNTVLHVQTVYDVRNNPTRRLNDGSTTLRTTSETRDGWQTRSIDANGNQTIRHTDAFGNLIQVDEYNGAAVYATTTYDYNHQDSLTGVTDDAGNQTSIAYDLTARKTSLDDPDLGLWSYQYDNANNLIVQTDGRGQQLYFAYDDINRMETKHADAADGTLLAQWTYDAAGYLGLPESSTAHEPSGNVVVSYDSYDVRDRLTQQTWTVPGISGGTFAMAYTYHPDDQPATTTYPAGNTGTLGETVTHHYNTRTGLTERLTGTDTYVESTTRREWGAVATQQWGTGTAQLDRDFEYQTTDRRLKTLAADHPTLGSVYDYTLGYDNNGNITSLTDAINAGQQQCFTYDHLNRLTTGYTKDSTTCANDPNTGIGDAGYDYSYTYDEIGNILTNTEASPDTYVYGDNAGPHAVTSIGATHVYTYDGNGNQQTAFAPGRVDQTLTWDANNRLQTVTDGITGTTTFTYDADGNRVVRATADEATTYIGGVYEYNETLAHTKTPELVATDTVMMHGDNNPTIDLPAGIQQGDVILIHVGSRMPTNTYVTDWGGLTEIHQTWTDRHTTSLAFTVAEGGEDEITLNLQYRWGYQTITTHIWRGLNTTTPIGVEATRGDYSTTANHMTFAGITTTQPDATIVAFAYGRNTGPSYTPPLGWIEDTDIDIPFWRGATSGHTTATDAGATGDITFTRDTTTHPLWWTRAAASIIQLQPETTAAATNETSYYTFDGQLIAQRTNGTLGWIITDHLGSPATTINTTTDQITRRLHTPYGQTRLDTGIPTDRDFTGQYVDDSTSLHFYNARYYDASVGRFNSPDSNKPNPTRPRNLDAYGYVTGNPSSLVDPSGHDEPWNRPAPSLQTISPETAEAMAADLGELQRRIERAQESLVSRIDTAPAEEFTALNALASEYNRRAKRLESLTSTWGAQRYKAKQLPSLPMSRTRVGFWLELAWKGGVRISYDTVDGLVVLPTTGFIVKGSPIVGEDDRNPFEHQDASGVYAVTEECIVIVCASQSVRIDPFSDRHGELSTNWYLTGALGVAGRIEPRTSWFAVPIDVDANRRYVLGQ